MKMSPSSTFITFIFLIHVLFVSSQVTSPTATLKNGRVKLTFNIPLHVTQDKTAIKLDRGDKTLPQNVLYVYSSNFSTQVDEDFRNYKYYMHMTVTSSVTQRKVEIEMSSIRSTEAGMYQCWNGVNQGSLLKNCGHKLIVLLKPDKPSIFSNTTAVEGQTLKLFCQPSSTSLPPDHGLESDIIWQDEKSNGIASPAGYKFVKSADGHLEILNIQSTDDGRKITCKSSDKAKGITDAPVSEPSSPYVITTQNKPSYSEMILNPFIISDTKMIKKESEEMTITCAVRCVPACNVSWSFKAVNAFNFSSLSLKEPHTLSMRVKRADQGTYRCTGANKHGEAYKEFQLEVHYISTAVVSVNERPHNESIILLVEKEQARLQCTIDANPAPRMTWNSPTRVLVSEEKKPSPQVSSRALQNNYTSFYTLNSVQCEDIGIYSCEGYSRASSVEKKIFLFVLCPPSSADIPHLKLEPNYVWDVSKGLSFSFVIKAYPEPEVTRVVSSVNNSTRPENITTDVFITKMSRYNGRNYLTQFTLTIPRTLDEKEINRVFTLTFQSKYHTRELQFVLRPRDRTTLNVGVIAGIVVSVIIFILTLLAIVIIRRKSAASKGRDEKCTKAWDDYDTCTQDIDTNEDHYQSLDAVNIDYRTLEQRNKSAEICKTSV